MGMVVHGVADDACDLVEASVVALVHAVQNAALDRLQTVVHVWNRPVLHDIGGIFKIIVPPLLFKIAQLLIAHSVTPSTFWRNLKSTKICNFGTILYLIWSISDTYQAVTEQFQHFLRLFF